MDKSIFSALPLVAFLCLFSRTLNLGDARAVRKHESFVGFTAFSQQTQYFNYPDRLEFTGGVVNEGNQYDFRTSEFTCPVKGVYYASLNLRRNNQYDIAVRLVKQSGSSEERVFDVESSHIDNPSSTVSNSLLFECDAEDLLFVQAIDYTLDYMYGEELYPFSTFTVILLYPTEESSIENKHDSFNGFGAFKDDIQEYGYEDVINFNGVVYSDGNYGPVRSAYTCPVDGMYFVNYNMHSYGALTFDAQMEMDGLGILDMEVSFSSNSGHTYSNARLVECTAGSVLEVIGVNSEGVIFGAPSRFTTFNAFYLGPPEGIGPQHEDVVGFSVYNGGYIDYVEGDTLRFYGSLWNPKLYYNMTSGIFECPRNGVYYVYVNYLRTGTGADSIKLDVVRQRDEVIIRTDDNANGSPYIGVSNNALTRCFVGETIEIKAFEDGSVYGSSSGYYTTFTVFLLYEY